MEQVQPWDALIDLSRRVGVPELAEAASVVPKPYRRQDIAELVAAWSGFAGSFNELSRSMGKTDPYPFTLSPQVVQKLGFVHTLVLDARSS